VSTSIRPWRCRPAFDGIFAAGDLIALGAIRSLLKTNRKVPEDVAVVGYDNIQLSAYTRPSLTTVSQDMGQAGRLMVSKLLSAGETGTLRSERLPTELIVRESCSLV
jgi:DNA-binding LacI/PurR family transcriptional regulator